MQDGKFLHPRNDFVLFEIVNVGRSEGGVVIPDISTHGKERIVVAIGPKVEDLEVGDRVFIIGVPGQDWSQLPNFQNLFITREGNVVLINRREMEVKCTSI